jgi:hypothetical protein
MERSAEWLRGAAHAAAECKQFKAAGWYQMLLAEAEAREASVSDGDALSMAAELKSWGDRWNKWVGPAGDESRYKRMAACAYAGAEALRREASVPTAAEVIAAAEKALHQERQGLQNIIDFCGFWFGGERRYGALTMDELTEAIERMEAVDAEIAKWKEAHNA